MVEDLFIKEKIGLESVNCPTCGTAPVHSLTVDSFRLCLCQNCGLGLINPRPDRVQIARYYQPDEYTPFLSSDKSGGLFAILYKAVRAVSVRRKRHWVSTGTTGRAIADIGCGTGEFLAKMKRAGWTVTGYEPSTEAAEYARRQYGVNVVEGTFDDATMEDETVDVVTMWHSLEHMHSPQYALTRIRRMLRENGMLVIAVPNRLSFDARMYGADWIAYDVPRHLFHFTPSAMKALLSKAGFTILRYRQMPIDVIFNVVMSEAGLVRKKGFWMLPFSALRVIFVTFVSLLSALFSGNGSAVVYFARKDAHGG